MSAVYNQPSPQNPITVLYTGTDPLGQGYAFCYDLTATDGSQCWKVTKPAAGNINAFAGTLDDSCVGKVGPCMIQILPPGNLANVAVSAAVTKNTSKLKVVAGSYQLAPTTTAGDDTVAVATETLGAAGVATAILRHGQIA